VQQRRLSGVIKTEEEEFGMLVEKAKGGQKIPNCSCGGAACADRNRQQLLKQKKPRLHLLGEEIM